MRGIAELAGLVAAGSAPPLAYLAVGLWLLRALGDRSIGAERLALGFVLGTGTASLAILALRAADLPVPLPALALVAATALPLLRAQRAANQSVASTGIPQAGEARAQRAEGERSRKRLIRAVDAASLAVGLLLFVAALGPETSWDGLEYHLPMIQAWCDGPIRALPHFLDAELRAGVDLLYVPAVAAGWPDAAAAVSAGFALALAALIRAEASRRASPGAGALAGFFALVVPLTQDAYTTYVDLGVGSYGFVALLAADRWNRRGEARDLWLSALCLGFAVNAKLHAAALAPAALAIVLLGGRVPPLRLLVGCAAATSLVVAPWLAKQAATTGNPFFPFLGGWLGTGASNPAFLELRRVRLGTDFAAARDPIGLLRYVASIHFGRNPHVSGLVGPLILALGPFAWQRPARGTRVLAGSLALLFALQFAFMPALRFGTPLLAFGAVAAAVGGARIARSGAVARAALGFALALLVLHHTASFLARAAPRIAALRDPWPYAQATLPHQIELRELVATAEPVVAIPTGAVFWMGKPVYNLHWQRNGELFFGAPTPPEVALGLLRRRGVRSLAIEVAVPAPAFGVGHSIVDAWLREGQARLRPDPTPRPARPGRVWRLVELPPD